MESTELLQAILDSPTRHAIIVTDAVGRILLWNKGAARIFQYSDEDVIGTDARALFPVDDRSHGVPEQEMETARRDGCAGNFRWHVRKDGTLFWADGMIYPIHSRSGVHMGYVKILRDATKEKATGEATSRLALEDSLTGLANRAEFHNRFVDMAASAQRHAQQLILMLVDLDRFKEVNDTLGHAAGDALLQQVAHRMRSVVRDTDFIARLGGDEFVVLLPDAEAAQEGGNVADKLVDVLARPFQINQREVGIGASIGLSVYPQDAEELDRLFNKADLALYRAKAGGRNRYRYYSAQLDVSAHRRNLEHAQLRRAVKDRAFTLHYQPQVDAATGKVRAVEALLRCSDPFFNGYPVERMLEIAAETGRMRRLGLWAFAEAARQVRGWQLQGRPDLVLAMNVCRTELADSRFARRVTDLLARHGLAPSQLEIEIAATQLGDDFEATQIAQLRREGVSVVIDDVGAGGLSLKHLFELPISAVKLDLHLLKDVETDSRSRTIALAIIELAHALGIRVVAQRVETQSQAGFFGPQCDAMQGFHYATPMTADDMTTWLKARAPAPMATRARKRTPDPAPPRLGAASAH